MAKDTDADDKNGGVDDGGDFLLLPVVRFFLTLAFFFPGLAFTGGGETDTDVVVAFVEDTDTVGLDASMLVLEGNGISVRSANVWTVVVVAFVAFE
jgi:hypothetical protein